MKALLEHLYFLAQYLSETDLETITAIILIDLGFPVGRQSFDYLVTAILRYKSNPEQLITWELYPDIGKLYGMNTRMQVEITMRREIRKQWKKRNPDKWNLYFPDGITTREKGPANSELIFGMAQVLRIWEGCCENYRKKVGETDEQVAEDED